MPVEVIPLSEILEQTPKKIVEIERVVARDTDRVMTNLWIRDADYAENEAAVNDDPSIRGITKIDGYEDGTPHGVEWTQNIERIVDAYLEVGISRFFTDG